jgi:hypothetical protein
LKPEHGAIPARSFLFNPDEPENEANLARSVFVQLKHARDKSRGLAAVIQARIGHRTRVWEAENKTASSRTFTDSNQHKIESNNQKPSERNTKSCPDGFLFHVKRSVKKTVCLDRRGDGETVFDWETRDNAACATESPPQGRRIYPAHGFNRTSAIKPGCLRVPARSVCNPKQHAKTAPCFSFKTARPLNPSEALLSKNLKSRTALCPVRFT